MSGPLDFTTGQPVGPGGTWTLRVSDDFVGNSLDSSKWITARPDGGNTGWGEGEWYDPSAVTVANSLLTITMTAQGNGSGRLYKSGVVASGFVGGSGAPKFIIKPGDYLESVIIVPSAAAGNMWPAFWGIGQTGWPPEIDYFEFGYSGTGGFGGGANQLPAPNWHPTSSSQSNPNHNTYGTGDARGTAHNYGMHWNLNGNLDFYFDGVLGKTIAIGTTGVATIPQVVIYSHQTETNSGVNTPNTYQVDWIRVWSIPASGSDTTPPSVPTGLSATATSSTVSLAWTPSTDNVGVLNYQVFRAGAKVGTTAGASFVDAGLAPATTYTYTVAAVDSAGNTSAQSASISKTTLPASTGGVVDTAEFDNVGKLPMPGSGAGVDYALFDNVGVTGGSSPFVAQVSNFTAVANMDGTILLTWTAVANATGYQIDTNPVNPGLPALTSVQTTNTSYVIIGLVPGQPYTFTIFAFSDLRSGLTSSLTATSTATVPGVVSGLILASSPDGSISLAWSAASFATSYEIIATSSDDSFVDYFGDIFGSTETVFTTNLGYTFADLVAGHVYTFTVYGINPSGAGTGISISGTSLVTRQPPPVATPVAKAASNIAACSLNELSTSGPYAGIDPLSLLPHTGGIYIQSIDPGYPVVRENTSSSPDSHGDIDLTRFYAGRAVAVAGVCIDGPDAGGNVQSSAYWLERVREWMMLGRNIALRYTLRGQPERYLLVRPDALSSVIDYTAGGSSRLAIAWLLGYRSATPFTYGVPPTATADPADPLSYVFRLSVDNGNVGGIELPNSPGMALTPTGVDISGGAQTRSTLAPGYTGFVPAQPVVRIINNSGTPIVAPVITMFSADGTTVASTIDLSATIAGSQLTIASGQRVVIDVNKKTALLFSNTTGSSVRKYLAGTPPWATFQISGSPAFHFTTTTGLTNTQAAAVFVEISYRSTFL